MCMIWCTNKIFYLHSLSIDCLFKLCFDWMFVSFMICIPALLIPPANYPISTGQLILSICVVCCSCYFHFVRTFTCHLPYATCQQNLAPKYFLLKFVQSKPVSMLKGGSSAPAPTFSKNYHFFIIISGVIKRLGNEALRWTQFRECRT